MKKTYNNSGRNQLAQFIGQKINFAGLVVDTKCPTADQRFICLRKMDIERNGYNIHCHHMWLDISHLKDVKLRLCEWLQGNAYVEEYTRRDGSQSYGITEAVSVVPMPA